MFNVCQFFVDGSYEYEGRGVSAAEAVRIFFARIQSVGAVVGTTTRVIITDDGDSINMEWKYEDGITYPPNLSGIYRPAAKEITL